MSSSSGIPGGEPGVRFTESTPLVASALALLEKSPQPAVKLARSVLGLGKIAPALAQRLIGELLGSHPLAAEDGQGLWRLRRSWEESCGSPVPLEALSFAVVDVETTGKVIGRGGRIVEIGIVHVGNGEIAEEFSSLVNPGVPMTPWVSDLTGIDDRLLVNAPSFGEMAGCVREAMEGRVFVAHNARFDWSFICEEMSKAGAPLPQGPQLCTLRLARFLLPDLERRGLDSMIRYYGIENQGRHRALGDALATAKLLLRLLEEAGRQGMSDWNGLRRRLNGGTRRKRGGDSVESC